MSSYFSSEPDQSRESIEFKYKNLFSTQEYISNSIDLLDDWKQNVNLPALEYLQKEAQALKKNGSIIRSAYQIRIIHFCESILTNFRQMVSQYQILYKNQKKISNLIDRLDQKLHQITKYLHIAEINNWLNFYEDLFPTNINLLYKYLRKSLLYCTCLQTMWFVLVTPKMFRKDQNQAIYKYSLSGNPNFYQKQTTLAKRKYISHAHCFQPCQDRQVLFQNLKEIINSQNIKDSNKMKAIFLIKGQFYNIKPPQTLKQSFIRESLRVYNCVQLSESWDHQKYENLCLQILELSQSDQDLIICLLYMQPELIDFENRSKILDFGNLLNKILTQILRLMNGDDGKDINYKFLQRILDQVNIQLFICLLINFQGSSKQIFSINNPKLHQTFLEIVEKMKALYLSFMGDSWICPISILNSITVKFFLKVSQDFTSQILANLPEMTKRLAEDKLPKKILIKDQKILQYKVVKQECTRIQYLTAIYSYIDDYLSKFPEQYIVLPQIYPTDTVSAILYVRSLQLKLKHHGPSNQETKNNFIQILQHCTQTYKIGSKFNWFKKKDHDCSVIDREIQFNFHKTIKSKWAQNLLQQLFNYRDNQKNQLFIRSCFNGDLNIFYNVIPYLKYAIGMNFSASRYNSLNEEELFKFLQEMTIQLQTIHDNIFDLTLEDEVNINYLHLCLMFYNVKIQEALDSQVYSMITAKIILPWIESHDCKQQKFKEKFKQFFVYHNLFGNYMFIGDFIINQIAKRQQNTEFSKIISKKINFYCKAPIRTIQQIGVDEVQQLLLKILSLFSPDLAISYFIPMCEMFVFLQSSHSTLSQQFSLDFAIDFYLQQKKLMKIIQCLNQETDTVKNIKICISNKFDKIVGNFSLLNASKLLKITYQSITTLRCLSENEQKRAWIECFQKFPQIPQDRSQTWLIKGIIAITIINYGQTGQKVQGLDQKCDMCIKKMQQSFNKIFTKQKICFKNLLPSKNYQIKEKYIELIQLEKQGKQLTLSAKFAKVWCKTFVFNAGTFEDIITFGLDPLQYIKKISQNSDMQIGIQIIKENKIKYEYFKKIINKLPVLQKCAQEAIKTLNNPTPQLICKLILINSKYHSEKLEQYILQKLQIFTGLIPVKIYQPYLIRQIKKELVMIPDDFVENIFLQKSEASQNILQKVNQVFYKILCLPLKKFSKIRLDSGQSIHQSSQNSNLSVNNKKKKHNNNKKNKHKTNQVQPKLYQKQSEQWKTQSQGQQGLQQSFISEQQNMPSADTAIKQKQIDLSKLSEQIQQLCSDSAIKQKQIDLSKLSEQIQQLRSDSSCNDEDDDKPQIAQMFYNQDDQNLSHYKRYIILRQQIDLIVNSSYFKDIKKYHQIPQYQVKMRQIVKELSLIANQEIIKDILMNCPKNFYHQLKHFGLQHQIDLNNLRKKRRKQKQLPSFEDQNGGDYVSDRNNDSDEQYGDDDQEDFEEDIFSQSDEQSIGNSQIDSSIGTKGYKRLQSSQDQLTIELPDLKQVNSKIQIEVKGDQFQKEELVKIMSIALFKLFTFSSSQRQLKAVISFYKQMLDSQFIKIFIDTALVMFRVDQKMDSEEKYKLQKKFNQIGISIRKGVDSFITLVNQINLESQQIQKQLIEPCQQLLPIGEAILSSGVKIRDNRVALMILLTKLNISSTGQKLRNYLSKLNNIKPFKFQKSDAKTITKFIYINNASISVWKFLQQSLDGSSIEHSVQLSCCVSVYGRMLRKQIQKMINIDTLHLDEQNLPFRYKQKIAQNLMRVYAKKIKHYYFWSKNCLVQIDHLSDNFVKFLRNKDLIQLTQMMLYYIRAMKIRFHDHIDTKSFYKIISCPEKIIKISCIYLWYLKGKLKLQNWKSLKTVQHFFNFYKYSTYQFSRLQEVFNLILGLSSIDTFSQPKYKQVIIPFLVKNPQISKELPLMFKSPRVPEEADGQRVYVTRQCSFDMALFQLKGKSMLVEFHQEEGSDYGGMVRELLMGWKGVGIGDEGFFVGKILGISFKNSIPYGGQFDLPMAIAITNFKVNLDFMKQHDKQVYESLKFIQENDPEDLQLKFTVTKQKYGRVYIYPLKKNGEQIDVTEQNKDQYINLYTEKYYSIGRQWELQQIKQGFYSIVYNKYAEIFHPIQIIQKIRGQEVTDYMKLKKKAKYQEGFTENSPVIKWFWEILSSFNQQEMNKFIQFLTGAPKVSLYDPYFTFTIEKTYQDDEKRLPVAHTCFSTLDLPEYSTKQILQTKLKQAIFQGNDNFGIL